jgi:hypothetical protein
VGEDVAGDDFLRQYGSHLGDGRWAARAATEVMAIAERAERGEFP